MSDDNVMEVDDPDPPVLSTQVFGNNLILSNILSFLNFENLVGCRLVNGFWNRNSLPYLLKTSVLGFERLEEFQKFDTGEPLFHQVDAGEPLFHYVDEEQPLCSKLEARGGEAPLHIDFDPDKALQTLQSLHHPHIKLYGEQGVRILATHEGLKGSILPWVRVLDVPYLKIKTEEQLGFFHEIMGQVAPRVQKIRISGEMEGDEVKDKGIFPSSVIFPQLKSVSVRMQNNNVGIKGPQFLQDLFTAAPNLKEVHLDGNATTTELVEVVGNQFPGLSTQITNLTLAPPKSFQDLDNVYGILQKFKGVKTLKMNGIELDERWEQEDNWKAYISKFALLSSPSLTTLKLDVSIDYNEPYSCPLYFPHSPNLERLHISTCIVPGDDNDEDDDTRVLGVPKMKVGFKDEKGNHLDVINYEKCFPKLKELTLSSTMNRVLEGDPFWKRFLPPGGVVCKTLRNLNVCWRGCDYDGGGGGWGGSGIDVSEVKDRIASVFPNANVTVGNDYFHNDNAK